jgi:hypothetical protein
MSADLPGRDSQSDSAPKLDDALLKYREQLVTLEQLSQTSLDREVMALSGGALGVSFAFVEKFLGGNPTQEVGFLVAAWAAWVGSLLCVPGSHYCSTLAMRKAIDQVDNGTVRKETPGGRYDVIISCLNGSGGVLFLAGAALAGFFVFSNI